LKTHSSFFVFIVTQWVAAYIGDVFRRTVRPVKKVEQEGFNTVLSATLTPLALIIGFSFSMAVNDNHQRRNYEAAEANAIGTEYIRADFLPTDDGKKARELLSRYNERAYRILRAEQAQFNGCRPPGAVKGKFSERAQSEVIGPLSRAALQAPRP
jgi:hypothetical protein